MKFKELKLSKQLNDAITEMGYVDATPIQEEAIPLILKGKDMIGIAQTGTGKTAAFSLPMLDILIKNAKPDHRIKALILSPTRELAIQTRDNIRDYAKNTEFKCGVVLGGVNVASQRDVLKKGVDILVATPGRLLDLIHQHVCKLEDVGILVLDEADTMLDMGFINDVRKIVKGLSKIRQTLLFTATMSKEIKTLTEEFLVNPELINVAPEEVTADKIKQTVILVKKENKVDNVLDIINDRGLTSALIFTRTKHGANKLENELKEYGLKISVIHGNKAQTSRVKALKDFKSGMNKIMIATDIAARGIDIPALSHVINYDLPEYPEVYVHRIGRTARAGLDGIAISLCSESELGHLRNIEKLIGMSIPCIEKDYLKADASFTNSTTRKRSRSRSKNNNDDSSNARRDYKKHDDSSNTRRDYKKHDDSSNTRSYNKEYSSNNSNYLSKKKRSNNYHSPKSYKSSRYDKKDSKNNESYKSLKGYKYIDK